MKQLKLLSLSCILLSFPIYAEEIPVASPAVESSTIEKQSNLQKLISQVKSAPDKEKRVLMNQLKLQLKNMNQENREQAMKELKKSFAKKESPIQQKKHETYQHGTHQPKFRHLQKETRPHTEQGRGGHQGNGQK